MYIAFYKSSWCSGCKVLDEMLKNTTLPYPLITIDIDKNPELAAQRFATEIPTLMLIYGDTVVARRSGSFSELDLKLFLDEGRSFNETN